MITQLNALKPLRLRLTEPRRIFRALGRDAFPRDSIDGAAAARRADISTSVVPTPSRQDAYGGKIFNQLRRLGSSMDWSRERFTMDEMLSKAVKEAFVRMHKDGLIYRDNRLVNWCCRLKTAISDIEVDHVDLEGSKEMSVPGQDGPVEFGSIWSFAYKYADGEGEIVVATTRPETMLGDTAVAVHPDDPRYKAVQGKMLVHPFNGRKIPVICDAELVDMSFGTGAVKITPAHDPNDFMTGKRHNLEFINMLTEEGKVNDEGGEKFKGMKRFTARKAVIAALDELGLYRGKEDNPMRLGLCSRSKDVIEPMLKPQWWVNCPADGGGRVRGGAHQGPRDSSQLHGAHVVPLAGEHPRLVHLPPAVVGPPHPRVLRAIRGGDGDGRRHARWLLREPRPLGHRP